MEKKKELIYHTCRTLYAESVKNQGCHHVVFISGFLYRIKQRLWGFIPLPCKYEEKVEKRISHYPGDFNELVANDFSANDQRKVENEIEDIKNTLTDKRKEFAKRKKK